MFLNFGTDTPTTVGPPPTQANTVLAVIFSLHFIALLFVSARIFIKTKLGKLGLDDVLIVISSLMTLSLLILTAFATRFGFGTHISDFKPEWILPYGIFSYTSVAIASVSFSVTKASVILFFLRLATERSYRIVCYLAITYITMYTSSSLMINLFGCKPISGGWDRRPTNPSVCVTNSGYYYYATTSNAAMDVMLLVLPIPIVLRLRLAWRVKLGLVAMFSMGFLTTGVSGISLWKLYVALDGNDIIWDGAISWMWMMTEFNVGIMTACMPGVKLFVKWMRGKKAAQPSAEVTIGGGGGVRHQAGLIMIVSTCASVMGTENPVPGKELVVHAELVLDARGESKSLGLKSS